MNETFILSLLVVAGVITWFIGNNLKADFGAQAEIDNYFKKIKENYPKELADEINLFSISISAFNEITKEKSFKNLSEEEADSLASDIDALRRISEKSQNRYNIGGYFMNGGFWVALLSAFWMLLNFIS
jgi:hypothetical protein